MSYHVVKAPAANLSAPPCIPGSSPVFPMDDGDNYTLKNYFAIAGILVLLSAPGIIGGMGLLKRQSWARILVLVLGVINLINIPFGTALGIYTIWALTHRETEELFRSG